eukprot:513460-Pyramimonas_sp.AAC.1
MLRVDVWMLRATAHLRGRFISASVTPVPPVPPAISSTTCSSVSMPSSTGSWPITFRWGGMGGLLRPLAAASAADFPSNDTPLPAGANKGTRRP